jgi:hypothetical protein
MKLTKSQLKQIINEEISKVLTETGPDIEIYKGQGPDVSPSGPSPAEEIIAKYEARSAKPDVLRQALELARELLGRGYTYKKHGRKFAKKIKAKMPGVEFDLTDEHFINDAIKEMEPHISREQ